MIEPFLKGSGFLQLPLGEKENENVLRIFAQRRNISPKNQSSPFSYLKPSQVVRCPFFVSHVRNFKISGPTKIAKTSLGRYRCYKVSFVQSNLYIR